MARIVFLILLVFLHANGNATSAKTSKYDSKRSYYEICDFRFERVGNLVLTSRAMSQELLRSRVENERYNACPFKVNVKYFGISFDIGFGQSVTLDTVEHWDEQIGVDTGIFQYEQEGWEGVGNGIEIEKSDIFVRNVKAGIVVSGIFRRENGVGNKLDYCFGVSAIGKDRYLTGLVCRPTRQALKQINDLFRKNTVISF